MRRPAADHPAALFDHPCLRRLQRCTTPSSLKQAHAQLLTTGLALHTYPLSRLLLLSSLTPPFAPSYALAVLRGSPRPTTFLYNIPISAFSSGDPTQHHLPWSLYAELAAHPLLRPNSHTYPSLFRVCALRTGLSLHAHVLKFVGDAQDRFVRTALVSFYSRCGRVDVCRHLFDRIPHPDLACWNAILSAYSHLNSDRDHCRDCEEALVLFHEMQLSNTRPHEITLVSVIGACGTLGALSQGMWLHACVQRSIQVLMNHFVGTALIDMYGKCGRLDLAVQVFDKLPLKDTLCYNAMLRGLAMHGHGQHALKLFGVMRGDGVRVDEVTLLVVMSACAHAGLVDEGRRCFSEMKALFGIEPRVEHYGSLVDLLSRAGCVEEAEETIKKMPMRPNAAVYRALLAACRIHKQFEIGERTIGCLLQLEPDHGGNYVLLSNMYANKSRWEDVTRVRKMMKDQGINKDAGCSFLEIGGSIHEFVRGDMSHPNSREINAMLEEMGRKLQVSRHQPRTEEVLFDIEEEDKEDTLSYHSERLAVAFALVASKPGTPIHIIKNLRVCDDCHSSTKLISKIYNREIIVRDRSRFHHFRYGKCSCLDFW
uniref:Pentatricopeptide repeat-containing protein At5g66520 n=1 Tax=Anthurium amnicola TaxID=1678845 RepID=A0A1D1XER9_9ARAE